MTGPHLPGCFACEQDQRTDLPPRERVSVTEHWRVAHAFDSALSGWLVVLPRRHVEAIAKLQREEAAELGPLLTDLSRAWAR